MGQNTKTVTDQSFEADVLNSAPTSRCWSISGRNGAARAR
jgi:hypothetical protein